MRHVVFRSTSPICKPPGQLIALLTVLAGFAACATESAPPSQDEATLANIERLVDLGHTGIADIPRVDHLALTASNHAAFIAGNLGLDVTDVASVFAMRASSLTLVDSIADDLGMIHERYEQTRDGLVVVGGDLLIGRDAAGAIVTASGAGWDVDPGSPDPSISEQQARDTAMALTAGATTASAGALVYVATSTGGSPVLSWRFRLEGSIDGLPIVDDVFIDATTGDLADRHPHIHTARNRQTYNANNTETLGTLARAEGAGPTGNTDVDLAHDAAGATYDCLLALFGRDSFDGAGSTLVSVANFGVNYQNAFWTGAEMVYGQGFAIQDVGTHEFGHGVTTSTANMVYQNEPGALNEAWSDILSAVCDVYQKGSIQPSTWQLGEDLGGVALRYLNNPTQDGISRDYYADRYLGTEDEGGVHINSGIANLAFVLLTEGGIHPAGKSTIDVQAIGIQGAGQIFHRALTTYMNTTTDFLGARTATERAALDIFGAESPETFSVAEAWYAVGVGGPPPARPAAEPEPEETGDDTGDGTDDGSADDPGTGSSAGGSSNATSGVTGGCSAGGGAGSGSLPLLLGLLAMMRSVRRRRRV